MPENKCIQIAKSPDSDLHVAFVGDDTAEGQSKLEALEKLKTKIDTAAIEIEALIEKEQNRQQYREYCSTFSTSAQAVCAAVLSIIDQHCGITNTDCLRALIGVITPECIRHRLPKEDIKKLRAAIADAPSALFDADLQWPNCLHWLIDAKAVQAPTGSSGTRLVRGTEFLAVRGKLPCGTDKLVSIALPVMVKTGGIS